MVEKIDNLLDDFVEKYIANVRSGFDERWSLIVPEIYDKHVHECIGGLLSRQATLTIEMAKAPSTWNGHVAPLILRCMIDAYITLAWILDEPIERSEKYINYGLGQEKLFIEYMEQAIDEDPEAYDTANLQKMIQARKSWLDYQLAEWATEVNIGSWSGMNTREMAKAIGRESIYKYAYVPFSGTAHNMWQHIGRYNMSLCKNPLHKLHFVPKIHNSTVDPDFMYRSAKYLTLSFQVFDENMEIECDVVLPNEFLIGHPLFSVDDDTEHKTT